MTPSPLRLAFALVWRRRGGLGVSVLCHLGERLLLLSLPILATRLVGDANATGTLPRPMIAGIAAAIVGLAGLRYLGAFFGIRAQEQAIRALRRELVGRTMHVPLTNIQSRRPGEIATLIGAYSEGLAAFAADVLREAVPAAVTLLGAYALLMAIDPHLGLVVLPTIAFAVIGTRLLSRTTRPTALAALDASTRLDGLVEETVELLPALRQASSEARHLAGHDAALDTLLGARVAEQRAMSWFGALSLLLGSLSLLLLVVIGTSKMTAGTIEPLDLVQGVLFTFVMLGPLDSIADAYGRLRKSNALSDKIAAVLAGPLEALDAGDDLPAGNGAIALESVSFSYPGRPRLFCDLSIDIDAQHTTALVGANGSGKTTTIRLLMRTLAPDTGTLRIDGADIATVKLRSLRRSIALVAQRDFIAYGTIRDNIDFGPDELTDAQVQTAAERAGLHAFVAELPDGYDTFVGTGGSALSGGQRKLLMLARALARDPRILILDEPTAMLDGDARLRVVAALDGLRGHTTIIVATHDPAVVDAADASIRLLRPALTGS